MSFAELFFMPIEMTQQKRINYVIWGFTPGGVELSIKPYLKQFRSKYKLHLFALRASENRLYDDHSLTIHTGGFKNRAVYWRFFRYCFHNRRSTFHLHNVGPVVLLLCLLAGVRRCIYHVHGTIHYKTKSRRKARLIRWCWRLVHLFPVHFVANSKYSAKIFQAQVSPILPQVIYNGFEVDRFQPYLRQRKCLKRIGFAGRLNAGKNVDLVIRLFESVAADRPELELHLAGVGPLASALKAQAAASPFRDRIHFRGFIKDIARFYGELDLFLFPSAYESFGNVVAEALLTGLPVLTSNISVFQEIHGGEPLFLLGNPEHYQQVEQTFQSAIADFTRLSEVAYAKSQGVYRAFDIHDHLRQIEALYVEN